MYYEQNKTLSFIILLGNGKTWTKIIYHFTHTYLVQWDWTDFIGALFDFDYKIIYYLFKL